MAGVVHETQINGDFLLWYASVSTITSFECYIFEWDKFKFLVEWQSPFSSENGRQISSGKWAIRVPNPYWNNSKFICRCRYHHFKSIHCAKDILTFHFNGMHEISTKYHKCQETRILTRKDFPMDFQRSAPNT